MSSEKVQSSEDFTNSYLPLIKGANRVLDTLATIWRYSVTVLLVSLSAIGAISIILFFLIGREVLFTEGFIFLAIAAWIFFRNTAGACNRCCNADIPHWKRMLSSFIQPNDSVDVNRDGLSVVESLMQVIDESADWIRLIRRDVFSVLFWPVIATLVLAVSVYSIDLFALRAVAILLIIYVFALIVAIYYSVNLKFRVWQDKIARFRTNAMTAVENI